MATLHYRESPPAPAAAPLLACHWTFRADTGPGRHEVIPDGCCSIVWRAGTAEPVVFGPRVSSYTVELAGGEEFFGARLWPFACRAALDISPRALRDTVQPLRLVNPALHERLTSHDLCDVVFATIAVDRAELVDPAVRGAVALIMAAAGDLRIGAVAPQLMLSPRQLERRFSAECGLTMKQFARIRRFRHAAAALLAGDADSNSQTAAAAGYADEAHLIRESAALAGVPPRLLLARLAEIRHGPLHY